MTQLVAGGTELEVKSICLQAPVFLSPPPPSPSLTHNPLWLCSAVFLRFQSWSLSGSLWARLAVLPPTLCLPLSSPCRKYAATIPSFVRRMSPIQPGTRLLPSPSSPQLARGRCPRVSARSEMSCTRGIFSPWRRERGCFLELPGTPQPLRSANLTLPGHL